MAINFGVHEYTKAIKKGKGYTFRLHRYKCNETRPGSISRHFENVRLIWMSGFLEWKKKKIYAKAAHALLHGNENAI